MKSISTIVLAAIVLAGCSPNQNETPTVNEPSGAQVNTHSNTSAISEEHGWTGTNESGRSTNRGISPGGANTSGTGNP